MPGPNTENIKVYARVRPLADGDRPAGWRVEGNSIYNADPSRGKRDPKATYTLDAMFEDSMDNRAVFEEAVAGLVQEAISGINVTFCAYGQTASGKTYTMKGTAADPGVIPQAADRLFELADAHPEREFLLRASYMELYNEKICDLLAPENTDLKIREVKGQFFVEGLREEIVASPQQALALLERGERHRRYGETRMNKASSRSHTLFGLVVESWPRGQRKEDASVRVASLTLVDLAGSERIDKTGAEGQRLKEALPINKSLSEFGNVIRQLGEKSGHVSFRNSKLTRMLQPSLGGNARTAIICTLSPAAEHVEETRNTLGFACRAKKVVNSARVNEVQDDSALLRRQAKEIEALRAQIVELKLAGRQCSEEQAEGLVAQLRAELLRAEQATQGIQQRLTAMAGALDSVEEDKERLLQEKEELEDQAAWALEEKGEAEKEAEAKEEELREAQDEVARLQGKLPMEIAKAVDRAVKKRTKELQAQLDKQGKVVKKQERTIKEQRVEIARLTAEVLEKEGIITELNDRRAKLVINQGQKRKLLNPQAPLGAAGAGAGPAPQKAKAGGGSSRGRSGKAAASGSENDSPQAAPGSDEKNRLQAKRMKEMMAL